jgi:hypothetical protein
MPILRTIAILATALAVLSLGCAGRQPLNVNSPIVAKPDATPADIAKAIIRAGVNSSWRIVEQGPGQLSGIRIQGPHTAAINISYTTKDYKVSIRESTLSAPDGTVHRTLNRWLQELDQQIRNQLLAI